MQYLIETVGRHWRESSEVSDFPPKDGVLDHIEPLAGGGLIVAGYERTADGKTNLMTFLTKNGLDWHNSYPKVDGELIDGNVRGLSQSIDGSLYLAYLIWNNSDVLRSEDGLSWQSLNLARGEVPGGITFTSVLGLSDGGVIAPARAVARGNALSPTIAVSENGATNWRKTRYEFAGKVFDHEINAMAELPSDRVVAVGDGALLTSLVPDEVAALGGNALAASTEPQRLLLPEGAAVIALGQKRQIDRQNQLAEIITQQRKFEATTKASYNRQNDAAQEIRQLTTEIGKSLRANEPFRQIAQTATRLAVIGLLIYLVQIVVNRYRYLQRLAGFYQARAQAMRLFAASPESGLLQGVSLADLTAMLSPDAIGFDKSAEPPTSQMVSLLQAGLRKA